MQKNKSFTGQLYSLFLKGWHPYFWLIVACFFIYLKTLTFYFTYFDDNTLILDNFWFLRDIGNILKCFTKSVFLRDTDLYYRPVMLISLMLDAQIGGIAPLVYHFTNILLHAAAACLVFRLFTGLSHGREKAFFISLLFMAHPALTQAVAWIPGRNDSLFGIFALLAFITYTGLEETSDIRRYALYMLYFNIALYAKETAVMLVPAGILYTLMVKKKGLLPGRTALMVSGWTASAVLWMVMRNVSMGVFQKQNIPDTGAGLKEILPGMIQYLGKAVLPFNLSVFPTNSDTSLAYGCEAAAIIAVMLLSAPRERVNRSLFGLAWLVMFILPPFIVPDRVRLEHRLYVPVIGFLMVLAGVKWPGALKRWNLLRIAGVSAVLLFASIAFVHSDNFINRLVFWKSAVKSSPRSSFAHKSLAVIYLDYGEKQLSETELLKAVELDPRNVYARINLAIAYTDKGMFKEAEREFQISDSLKPNVDITYYNYGLLCFARGDDARAEKAWLKTIALNPNCMQAYRSLAAFYFLKGNGDRSGYYSKLLNEKFSINSALPGSTVLDKRQWLYLYCKQGA